MSEFNDEIRVDAEELLELVDRRFRAVRHVPSGRHPTGRFARGRGSMRNPLARRHAGARLRGEADS